MSDPFVKPLDIKVGDEDILPLPWESDDDILPLPGEPAPGRVPVYQAPLNSPEHAAVRGRRGHSMVLGETRIVAGHPELDSYDASGEHIEIPLTASERSMLAQRHPANFLEATQGAMMNTDESDDATVARNAILGIDPSMGNEAVRDRVVTASQGAFRRPGYGEPASTEEGSFGLLRDDPTGEGAVEGRNSFEEYTAARRAREAEPGVSDAVIDNLANGATFGLGPTIQGAAGGEQARQYAEWRLQRERGAHPLISGGSELAGGLATGLLVPEVSAFRGIPGMNRAAGGILDASLEGAGVGFGTGFARSEEPTLAGRLEDGAQDAIPAGFLGAGFGTARVAGSGIRARSDAWARGLRSDAMERDVRTMTRMPANDALEFTNRVGGLQEADTGLRELGLSPWRSNRSNRDIASTALGDTRNQLNAIDDALPDMTPDIAADPANSASQPGMVNAQNVRQPLQNAIERFRGRPPVASTPEEQLVVNALPGNARRVPLTEPLENEFRAMDESFQSAQRGFTQEAYGAERLTGMANDRFRGALRPEIERAALQDVLNAAQDPGAGNLYNVPGQARRLSANADVPELVASGDVSPGVFRPGAEGVEAPSRVYGPWAEPEAGAVSPRTQQMQDMYDQGVSALSNEQRQGLMSNVVDENMLPAIPASRLRETRMITQDRVERALANNQNAYVPDLMGVRNEMAAQAYPAVASVDPGLGAVHARANRRYPFAAEASASLGRAVSADASRSPLGRYELMGGIGALGLGAASGHPVAGALSAGALRLGTAYAAPAASGVQRGLARLLEGNPGLVNRVAPGMARVLQNGSAADFASRHFELSQTSPTYRRVLQMIEEQEESLDNQTDVDLNGNGSE